MVAGYICGGRHTPVPIFRIINKRELNDKV
jgi:hypothetical protein